MRKTLFCILALASTMLFACADSNVIIKEPDDKQIVSDNENSSTDTDSIDDTDDNTTESDNEDSSTDTDSIDDTDDKTSESDNEVNVTVIDTTAENENTDSLFDPSEFSYNEAPLVKDAVALVQTEIFDESYEFTYTVIIPEIDSDKKGARELNQKIYDRYKKKLDVASAKKVGNLHVINYEYSSYDGILFIHIYDFLGLYQSEGVSTAAYYYYDSRNDRELTQEEYLAHFGIDAERLDKLSKWGIGDTEWHILKYGSNITDTSTLYDERPENGLSFSYYEEAGKPSGYEVTADTVYVYYKIRAYVGYEGAVEIDVSTGLPKSPNFYISSEPTGEYTANDDGMIIYYKNGEITDVLVGKNIPVKSVLLSNDMIAIISDLAYHGFDFYSNVYLNGEFVDGGGSSSLYGDGLAMDTYYIPRVDHTDEIVIRIINEVE